MALTQDPHLHPHSLSACLLTQPSPHFCRRRHSELRTPVSFRHTAHNDLHGLTL